MLFVLHLQHSGNAVLHKSDGVRRCWRAAYALTTQAVSYKHSNWQHNSGCEPANISFSCTPQQGKVKSQLQVYESSAPSNL